MKISAVSKIQNRVLLKDTMYLQAVIYFKPSTFQLKRWFYFHIQPEKGILKTNTFLKISNTCLNISCHPTLRKLSEIHPTHHRVLHRYFEFQNLFCDLLHACHPKHTT